MPLRTPRTERDILRTELLKLPPEERARLSRELLQSLENSSRSGAMEFAGRDRLVRAPDGSARDLNLAEVLGIGATWGTGWAVLGLAIATLLKLLRPGDFDPGETLGQIVGVFCLLGFGAGLGFVGLLAMAEGRRALRSLPLTRVALWGAVAAGVLPFLSGADPTVGVLTGVLGAGFAAGSVARRRRPPVPQADAALLP